MLRNMSHKPYPENELQAISIIFSGGNIWIEPLFGFLSFFEISAGLNQKQLVYELSRSAKMISRDVVEFIKNIDLSSSTFRRYAV